MCFIRYKDWPPSQVSKSTPSTRCLEVFFLNLFECMHDRAIYLPHSISRKNPISHTEDWFTGRRAAALAETDRCIIASSGRRWWVSKAVSCHRNPQRTIQRKQHRRLSGVISTHPLSATPPSHTQSTRSRRRCVVWGQKVVVVVVVSGGSKAQNPPPGWQLTCVKKDGN